MAFLLNPGDFDSINDFIIALDALISRLTNDMTKAMAYGIDHEELYGDLVELFLLRMTYEYDHEASSLITGVSTRITIPLTADMTFIFSDAIGI